MAASSSAVAVDPRLHKYDVFISFRSETRNSFTSHLYSALCQEHIKAYIDEVSLEKGDDIERALPKAIEESKISIIIFSENYASSRWCLDELVYILKCRKEKHQMFFPIFYGIDPSHVRNQKKSYAEAFVGHEERFEMERVQKWRQALRDAANISGWDSQCTPESVIVYEVVEYVRGYCRRQCYKIESVPTHLQKTILARSQHLECFSKWFEDLSMAASSSAVAVDSSLPKYDWSTATYSSAVAVHPSPLKFDSSMAASSSSAAADLSPPKYDVFISFRGEETRKGFTSHLYAELRKKQINAYIDEESLDKGDDISRALPKAIEESTISIIIFSKDYASSRWCLNELVHILKCREEKDQIVLPIFYGIDPSHIRHQKETYDDAFVEHQVRFEDKIVKEWRQALTRAADLSGWDLQDKSESVLVQQVVEDVIKILKSISSISIDDLKGLVGIRRQLCKIESLLCFDSPNVRILGIWGMGGIGKTTLADVVFKCFSNQFEGACFLKNVREESQRQGLVQLEKEVFSKLLGEKDPDVSNHFVNVRLSRTKALLVLDDVDNFEHLECLVGDRDRFGPGSKIILTSRDLQVLKNLNPNKIYEVQALDQNEASQLFDLKAFEENSDRSGYEEISAKVVRYTGRNPLALKVLGSSLRSLGIKDWESALKRLETIPNADIQKVLRISYDGLDPDEQDTFLDIACILKDKEKDIVEGILGQKSTIAITALVHKSLITIDQDGLICMHDLIQEMGWEIVRQSTKKLGKPSRLWTAKDVSYVLANNKGTEAIEGIYLPVMKEEVHLRPDVFEEMRKLRLLKIIPLWWIVPVYIDGDLKYLPDSLRYLHWNMYPGKSLPSNFNPENLVELHMPNSKLEQLWDGVQKLGSLKRINLCYSELTKIPDLSLAPKLESINLSRCSNLKSNIDGDLKYLPNSLRYLHWEDYPGKSLPSNFKPQNLVVLDMPNSKLEQLWDGVQKLGSLKRINLCYSELTKIPDLSLAPKLESINLSCCCNLKSILKLPRNIEVLVLDSSGRSQISSSSIESRQISSSSIESHQISSSSIESLENLLFLQLKGCYNLESLPKLPRNIEVLVVDYSRGQKIPLPSIECLCSLQILSLRYFQSIESFPSNINLKALEELYLEETSIQELPSTIENSIGLRHLYLYRCKHLKFIPKTLCKLTRLQELSLYGCSKLESFPMLSGLCSLTKLDLSYCNIWEIPDWLGSLTSLTELYLRGNAFDGISASIGMLYKLKKLDISKCKNLQSLPASIGMLYNLKKLDISKCKNLQSLPASIGMLYNLKKLDISKCKNLQSLPASIGMLHNLKKLDISKCKNLQSLPASIGMLYKLKKLNISNCKNIQSLPELPLFIESVNAEDCSSLEMVSTSRSTLKLGRWLDKYDSNNDQREFSFLNCTKLGEYAINNIFTEFLYKVFCTATTPPKVVHSERVIGELVVFYPTKEIPRWFNYLSEGSSITIELPPNWYNPKNFLGFVVSFVADSFQVKCELDLMTKKDRFSVGVFEYQFTSWLEPIVMCYKYFDHSKANFEKYQEASLEFRSHYGRVKRCGVRMLYLKDAVEESNDGSIANFESWRTDVMNSDTSDDDFQSCGSDDDYQSCGNDVIDSDYATTYDSDEPPSKRTRNL